MALRSQISAIVANQLGKMQGQIESRILDQVISLQSKFTSGCPNQNELVKVIDTRNTLLKVINNFQKSVNRFNSIPNQLQPPIQIANVIINLLKANPTPLAIGTPPGPGGGLIFAQSAGFTTSQADRLQKLTLLLEALEDDLTAVNDLLQGISPSINNVKQSLENLNDSIKDCVENLSSSDAQGARELLAKVRPLENLGSEGTPNETFTHVASDGKTYFLSIESLKANTDIAQQRVAVAKNISGVVILRGQPSFSSDTQVLLDEIKFRLDNQLA